MRQDAESLDPSRAHYNPVCGAAKSDLTQIKNVNAVSFHITDTESPGSWSKYFILSKYFTILETGESDCHAVSVQIWILTMFWHLCQVCKKPEKASFDIWYDSVK